MATIKSVSLTLQQSPDRSDRYMAGVTYVIEYGEADVGKRFRIGISLWGDDKNDVPRPSGAARETRLFNFIFHNFFYEGGRPRIESAEYAIFTPQRPEEVTDSESRILNAAILDEDPGTQAIPVPPRGVIFKPFPDEIFAQVTLLEVGQSGQERSEVQAITL